MLKKTFARHDLDPNAVRPAPAAGSALGALSDGFLVLSVEAAPGAWGQRLARGLGWLCGLIRCAPCALFHSALTRGGEASFFAAGVFERKFHGSPFHKRRCSHLCRCSLASRLKPSSSARVRGAQPQLLGAEPSAIEAMGS
jgi:hypothetical protein